MTDWLRPVAISGAERPAHLLAGQSHIGFDHVVDLRGGGLVVVDEARLARLADQRAPLCGVSQDRPRIMGIRKRTHDRVSGGRQQDT